MLDLVEGMEPFVAFVGAGASTPPPSNLPRWKEFNDLLLECLCERLAHYSHNRAPVAALLTMFRDSRDRTGFFAPDFQAQLMEEEVGAAYFRVWQSIDTEVYGKVHEALAEIALKGRLAAIVTTNFDRLIEKGMEAKGVGFHVFHDHAAFDVLPTALERPRSAVLPIVKIHGSIEDADSLVDTLKQRRVGRPEPLMRALQLLLRRHAWLYLGFSGADFSYDNGYLGILNAAEEARGFIFLNPHDRPIENGVQALKRAYGPEKASIVGHSDLAAWLSDAFGLPPLSSALAATADRDAVIARIKQAIGRWVEELGPMAVVNIIYSMLKTVGMEADAYRLVRKTWKSYRSPEDSQSNSYGRYNYNHGLSLLDAGLISNPIALAEDMSNIAEWKKHADSNAYEYLSRSYSEGKLLSAAAFLAGLLAYRGELGKAISLASKVTDDAIASKATLELCDVAIGCAPLYDVIQFFGPPITQFRQCLQTASTLGDEPRRAMLCALLGRFLTYQGSFDEADVFLRQAEDVAHRLELRPALLASMAARGLWLADSGSSAEEAVKILGELVKTIRALDAVPLVTTMDILQPQAEPAVLKARRPLLCRVLLDLNRAAMLAGDGEMMNQTLDELDEIATDTFFGYCPHYYFAYAQCLLTHGAGDEEQRKAADLIVKARKVGEVTKDPWATQQADHFERLLRERP